MSPEVTAHLIRHFVEHMTPEDRAWFMKKYSNTSINPRYYGKMKLDANGWHLGDVRVQVPEEIVCQLKSSM